MTDSQPPRQTLHNGISGCDKLNINVAYILGRSRGLREDSQQESGLLVRMECARNDHILAWLQLAVH